MTVAPNPRDQAAADRLEQEAMRWGFAMLVTEPLKVIAATLSKTPSIAGLLALTMLAQLLAYLYLGARVGLVSTVVIPKRYEAMRFAAAGLYLLYIVGFVAVFCFGWAPLP